MLINRATSDITSSRKRNDCAMILSQKSSAQVIGCADFTEIVVIGDRGGNGLTDNHSLIITGALNDGAQLADAGQHDINITDAR